MESRRELLLRIRQDQQMKTVKVLVSKNYTLGTDIVHNLAFILL